MPLFFLPTVTKDQNNQPEEHTLVPIHEPPHNTTEGSEFLDDAIRMKDQPLVYTEECVAAGSPKNLL
jgi:hypothetical protein